MMNHEDLNNINRKMRTQENINNNINHGNVINKDEKVKIIEESRQDTITTKEKYTGEFLKGQIGKLLKVEFLIGNNNLIDKIGFLEEVGMDYILLRSFEGNILIYADIYSIKFIEIISIRENNYQNYNSIGMNSGMNYNINRYY